MPGGSNVIADALSRSFEAAAADDDKSPVLRTIAVHEHDDMSDDSIKLKMEAELRGKEIPTRDLQIQLIQQTHAIGHFGVEHGFKRIWELGYWWPTLRQDLKKEIQTCVPCQRFNVTKSGYRPLMSIEAEKPFDHVEIDLVGPIPISDEGYDFFLTYVDVMSGYTVLRALKEKRWKQSAIALWEIICEYGTPKIIQSDNGTEFINQLIQQLFQTFGIDHRLITAYHPRANGLVERTNKEASKILKKVMIGATQMWERWLPSVQLALNTRVLERTGSTPFTIVHGRSFNGFIDFSKVTEVNDLKASMSNVFEHQKELHEVIFPAIAERTSNTRKKSQQRFNNTNKIVKSLAVGTIVYAVDQTRSSKWDPIYEGPFKIVEQHEGGSYSLCDANGERLGRRMTIDMLKPVVAANQEDLMVSESPSGGGGKKNVIDPIKSDSQARKKKKSNNKKRSVKKTDTKKMKQSKDQDTMNRHFRVERILDHKLDRRKGSYEYLVKWTGYDENENSWISASNFDDLNVIKKYWNERRNRKKGKY